MNSVRIFFSLRSLLVVFALLGLTLAVVLWNAEWLAVICYSVFLLVQCAAIVGAISRTGSARVFWLAFVVFGFGYGLSAFPHDQGPPYWPFTLYTIHPTRSVNSPVGPADVVDRLFQLAEPIIKVGDEVEAQWQAGRTYPAAVQKSKPMDAFL